MQSRRDGGGVEDLLSKGGRQRSEASGLRLDI
jgi:hypothetical protein